MKITYTSDTGRTFDTEAECRAYEEAQVELTALVAEVTALLGDRDGVVRPDSSPYFDGFLAVCVHTATLLFVHITDADGSPEHRYSVVDQVRSAEGCAATLRGAYDALVQELAPGTCDTRLAVDQARQELDRSLDKLNAEIHRSKDLLSYLGAPTP